MSSESADRQTTQDGVGSFAEETLARPALLPHRLTFPVVGWVHKPSDLVAVADAARDGWVPCDFRASEHPGGSEL